MCLCLPPLLHHDLAVGLRLVGHLVAVLRGCGVLLVDDGVQEVRLDVLAGRGWRLHDHGVGHQVLEVVGLLRLVAPVVVRVLRKKRVNWRQWGGWSSFGNIHETVSFSFSSS